MRLTGVSLFEYPTPPFFYLILGQLSHRGFAVSRATVVEIDGNGTRVQGVTGPQGERILWGVRAQPVPNAPNATQLVEMFEVRNAAGKVVTHITYFRGHPPDTVSHWERPGRSPRRFEVTTELDTVCIWIREALAPIVGSPAFGPSITSSSLST